MIKAGLFVCFAIWLIVAKASIIPAPTTGCVKSCYGLENGDYQSCTSCFVYASCWNGYLTDNRPCSPPLVWDDNLKWCDYKSATCSVVNNNVCWDASGGGYKVNENVPDNNDCEICTCTAEGITCADRECPSLSCKAMVTPTDACCPVCKVCFDENYRRYEVGDTVTNENPCKTCVCTESGEISCDDKVCKPQLTCSTPYKPAGQCCSVCTDDEIPSENPCEECTCTDKGKTCLTQSCTSLQPECGYDVVPENECCPVCKGQCRSNCLLPNCSCNRIRYPMPTRDIPQIVYFGFDDAVNIVMSSLYEDIFTKERKNPNGCRMKMSLYVSHEYTNYTKVKQFYDQGNEIGVHSVTHTSIDNDEILRIEANAQKENIMEAGVPEKDIVGWRSPFLQTAGRNQPQILKEFGFDYDISLTYTISDISADKPWPFTMDRGWPYAPP